MGNSNSRQICCVECRRLTCETAVVLEDSVARLIEARKRRRAILRRVNVNVKCAYTYNITNRTEWTETYTFSK